MLTGGTPESVVALLEGLHIDALGINCSLGPTQIKPFVERMIKVSSTPIIVTPNAGLPQTDDEGHTYYDMNADEFASEMKEIASLNVHVLGGCCGTTPEYLSKQ